MAAPLRPAGGDPPPGAGPDAGRDSLPPRILLYDGACGLCSRLVRWLLRRDRGRLWFAPLQGETAARLRALHPGIPAGLEGVAFVEDGRVHLRSRALLRAARHLPAPWRWSAGIGLLPAALLDPAYRLVARSRYRVFGRRDACPAPDSTDADGRGRLMP